MEKILKSKFFSFLNFNSCFCMPIIMYWTMCFTSLRVKQHEVLHVGSIWIEYFHYFFTKFKVIFLLVEGLYTKKKVVFAGNKRSGKPTAGFLLTVFLSLRSGKSCCY